MLSYLFFVIENSKSTSPSLGYSKINLSIQTIVHTQLLYIYLNLFTKVKSRKQYFEYSKSLDIEIQSI